MWCFNVMLSCDDLMWRPRFGPRIYCRFYMVLLVCCCHAINRYKVTAWTVSLNCKLEPWAWTVSCKREPWAWTVSCKREPWAWTVSLKRELWAWTLRMNCERELWEWTVSLWLPRPRVHNLPTHHSLLIYQNPWVTEAREKHANFGKTRMGVYTILYPRV